VASFAEPRLSANARLYPPGPKPHFLIGNIPLANRDPLALFLAWSREFGDIFHYRAGWVHVYFLNHPALIESVLLTQNQNFMKERVMRNSRWFFGEGLLTSEGSHWLRQRRLSQPAFHRERISSYAGTITEYAEQTLAEWKDGDTCDVHQEMMHLTVKIVAKVLFNVDVAEECRRISSSLDVLMEQTAGGRMMLPPVLRVLLWPLFSRLRRAVGQLDETVYGIIAQRRARGDSGDLLSMLLAARDEDGSSMTDRELRDEAMAFLLAGHETTALALSWTWYLLSQHLEAEQRLHEELKQVLDGRSPTAADLPRLTYTESVVKESMRLYPPAWGMGRSPVRPCEIGGYRVLPGASVVMSQWVMHRDPRYFADPERFDPARWSTESVQKLPRFVYFPFGGGPRVCIGAGFAMMEATLLLAAIAQKFQLRLVPEHPVVPLPSFTLRPKYGIRVTLAQRSRS
jgi:cytochrome P450